ncbi:MAG TPA: ribosome assembly RNA-binding protein YhbY [Lachnospiraceae bacterium]|nr:ribosome assembly RNA-binding protein YhbY [Lachnospiraceae bacterium]
MTSKQRAFLKSLASKEDTIVQIGKEALTPENTASIEEALKARELVKVGIGQNCLEDIHEIAQVAAERTRAQLVQVIGRKFVLYREGKEEKKKIILPPEKKSVRRPGQ